MSAHRATVSWNRDAADFLDRRYSRAHIWRFDGGLELRAAASPSLVPAALTDARAVDPEEAFVASLASCHLLWFLDLAARRGFCVDRYTDQATGTLGTDARGRLAITTVVLRPRVEFSGSAQPSADELAGLHHGAHERCFIANSVNTDVRCEPVIATS